MAKSFEQVVADIANGKIRLHDALRVAYDDGWQDGSDSGYEVGYDDAINRKLS